MTIHSYYYYKTFQALQLQIPAIVFYFAYIFVIFTIIVPKCWHHYYNKRIKSSICASREEGNSTFWGVEMARQLQEEDQEFNNGNQSNDNRKNSEGKIFKAFKAIIVAFAGGLLGQIAIRRKDYRNPPCLKIHGRLYQANTSVLLALLYYILAVAITVGLVSLGFSTLKSYGLDECTENIDCFYINNTDGLLNVTEITNCSLSFEIDAPGDIQCFVGLQPAVALALLGGFISFVPPLMFTLANIVHTTIIFETILKYKTTTRKCFLVALLLGIIAGVTPNLNLILLFVQYNERENENGFVKFIVKDTVVGQVLAIIITFSAFLGYPWFMLGKYRHYTPEEIEFNPELKKRLGKKKYCRY